MSDDRAVLDELLHSTLLAHIGLLVDGKPVVFPTGFAVREGMFYIHGSTGSRWMRALAGQEVSVTVTKLDGVVVARSTYESSMHYRSAMLFGRFEQVPAEEKNELLNALSDRMIPGRSSEVRESLKKELAATTFYGMPIDEWSLRVSAAWPEDAEADLQGDAWAGVVSFGPPAATIQAAPDLREGIPVPPSVRALAAHPERFV